MGLLTLPVRRLQKALGTTFVLFLLAAAFPVGATPAFNLFANAEFEACPPPPYAPVVDEPFPQSAQHRSSCHPWILRNADGRAGHETASRMSNAFLAGHGQTTSARITYQTSDGVLLFGQQTGVAGDSPVTPWRNIRQVTFDVKVTGSADIAFRADGVARDGSQTIVTADQGPIHLEDTAWQRHTFTFSDLVESDGRRTPFTGLWFEIHPTTSTDAEILIDNVYATNVYLEPFPGLAP